MAEAELQQLQRRLQACQDENAGLQEQNAVLEGQVAQLQRLLDAATSARESERHSKRQREESDAAAVGELTQELARCKNQLRQRDRELAELKEQQAAERRRSSGGSHPAGDQQQQGQPVGPPAVQPVGPPAEGAAGGGAGSGGAAAAEEPAVPTSGEAQPVLQCDRLDWLKFCCAEF